MPTRERSGHPPDGNVLLTIGQHMSTISSRLETNSQKSESNGHKLDRLGWHVTQNTLRLADMHQSLTSVLQNLKTSTKTEPTSPTPTATGASMPTTETARTQSWWRAATHVWAWAPRVLGWLAERLLPVLWTLIAPILLGLWAWGREGAEKLLAWVSGVWMWFAG